MSFEVVTFPQISTALTGTAIGLAPLIAGLGLAYGATKVVQKLRSDYEQSLAEFKKREMEVEHRQQAAQTQYMQATAAAESLAAAMIAEGAQASQVFVAASLEEVMRVAQKSQLEEIQQKAQSLIDALRENPESEDIAKDAVRLTAELHNAVGQLSTKAAAPVVLQLFQVARAEITTLEASEQREPLLQQLSRLESLAAEETGVAMQGLANLRERSTKLIHAQLASQSEREQRRELTGQAVAMLQALAKVPDAPENAEALRLLEQIGASYAAAEAPTVGALEGFLTQARALFDACTARLELAAKSAYITDAVADTLAELGYQVSHVPAEGTEGCLVSVDADTGMMVMVDKEGHLKTEMVAFNEQAMVPDTATQEKVCSLVDQVFEGLRKRDIQIKEKVRRNIKKDQKLKMVAKPEVETPVAEAKPKERALN
jgi:hypothetical protein